MPEPEHTPIPWMVSDNCILSDNDDCGLGNEVCVIPMLSAPESRKYWQANAEFICRACNSHDALVAALEEAAELLHQAQGEWDCVTETYAPEWTHPLKTAESQARAALAAAAVK